MAIQKLNVSFRRLYQAIEVGPIGPRPGGIASRRSEEQRRRREERGQGMAITAVLAVAGCQNLGPTTVRASMPAYNAAILETGDQMLMLNFVRIRYSESPYFMEVTNVFTSPSFTASAQAGVLAALSGQRGWVTAACCMGGGLRMPTVPPAAATGSIPGGAFDATR